MSSGGLMTILRPGRYKLIINSNEITVDVYEPISKESLERTIRIMIERNGKYI